MNESLPFILFGVLFLAILLGFPVAFTLGGVSIIFGILFLGTDFFLLLPLRIFGTMQNYVLIAVPLFIYMGIMLEKSGLAESMLDTMAKLFGKYKGGLAISVVIVGALLAASTGIVGATVITMGLISLPTMLKRGYSTELATGTIASSGTLGQIIPPSVVLVLLGSVLNVSVGDLFAAAVVPGILLVAMYIIYILITSAINPSSAPSIPIEERFTTFNRTTLTQMLSAFFLPFLLILAVLGSIFAGIASPTEAAAVGAMGATLLTIFSPQKKRKLSLGLFNEVMRETTHLTSMVFIILIGATAFSLVFRGLGGDRQLVDIITRAQLSPELFLLIVMIAIFIAGFFIDFIEIIFIFVPVVAPVFQQFGTDLIWVGILFALNLQTSFLSPPFGFALFYLKGVAPPEVSTQQLYRGIIPFVIIQLTLLVVIIAFPDLIRMLI